MSIESTCLLPVPSRRSVWGHLCKLWIDLKVKNYVMFKLLFSIENTYYCNDTLWPSKTKNGF